jgi:hypothetical protein
MDHHIERKITANRGFAYNCPKVTTPVPTNVPVSDLSSSCMTSNLTYATASAIKNTLGGNVLRSIKQGQISYAIKDRGVLYRGE